MGLSATANTLYPDTHHAPTFSEQSNPDIKIQQQEFSLLDSKCYHDYEDKQVAKSTSHAESIDREESWLGPTNAPFNGLKLQQSIQAFERKIPRRATRLVTENDAVNEEAKSLAAPTKTTRHLLTLKQGSLFFDSKQNHAGKVRNTLYHQYLRQKLEERSRNERQTTCQTETNASLDKSLTSVLPTKQLNLESIPQFRNFKLCLLSGQGNTPV